MLSSDVRHCLFNWHGINQLNTKHFFTRGLIPNIKWTKLNPSTMIPTIKHLFPQISTTSLTKLFKDVSALKIIY